MIRHLCVPGLLGPITEVGGGTGQAWPQLQLLLARADRFAEPAGYAPALFDLFGIAMPAGVDVPTAAVSLLGETGRPPDGFVMHADPLQLIPDRDSLLGFDLDADPLQGDELAELVEAFTDHFRDDGVSLFTSPGGHLHLRCERTPSIRTFPWSAVTGRSLDRFLPHGDDWRRWRSLLNETQMLCHALAFNRARESQGRSTLGGLWFSGGGRLPAPGRGAVARVEGDCRLARGLLALCGGAGDDVLVVDHAAGRAVRRADPAAWRQAVTDIDARIAALTQDCAALHVHPGNGTVWRWRPGFARRFWRRRRPLSAWLDAAPSQTGGPPGVKGL